MKPYQLFDGIYLRPTKIRARDGLQDCIRALYLFFSKMIRGYSAD